MRLVWHLGEQCSMVMRYQCVSYWLFGESLLERQTKIINVCFAPLRGLESLYLEAILANWKDGMHVLRFEDCCFGEGLFRIILGCLFGISLREQL